MEKNQHVMSLLIIRPFFTQRTVQFDQLLVVVVGIDSFTKFQHLIVDETLLIPPNAQQRLPSEAIWSWGDVDGWPGSTHDFSRLGFSKYIHFSSPITTRCRNDFLFCLASKISHVF